MRLFDADALVDALMMYTWYDEDGWGIDDAEAKREYIKGWLPDIPTIEAEPVRHGKWTRIWSHTIYDCTSSIPHYVCNECGSITLWESSYCPTCGAKMDEEA